MAGELRFGAGGMAEVVLPDIPLVNGQASPVMHQVVRDYLALAVSAVEGRIKDRATVGATGAFRSSIASDVSGASAGDVMGRVYSSLPYAIVLEEGRKPGPISEDGVTSIRLWVERVLGITDPKELDSVTFLVARKIRLSGFPAQHAFRDGYAEAQPEVDAVLAMMADVLAATLAGQAVR